MLLVGIPAGLEGSLFSIANVAIQSSINSFGSVAVSGNTAAANLEGFTLMTMMAFGQAQLSFMSQNVGAEKYDRVKKIYLTGLAFSMGTGLIIGCTIGCFGDRLLYIYSSNPEVIAAGLKRIYIMCWFMFLWGLQNLTVGALRGIGYSMFPTIVSIIGICGFRILWISTICKVPQFHTIEMVYISYPISWAVTGFILVIGFIIGYRRKIRIYTTK
jgi:Na+-driven multidrug efflux pump